MATSQPVVDTASATLQSEKPRILRVMTYNCLGLKYISHHRRARLSEIGRAISFLSPPPHIVGLQECWTQEDFASIRSQTSTILPYGKFYYSGCFGGGLAILSAFPIEESSMFKYPLNGRPSAIHRGDWYVGKGVACARIRLPTAFSNTVTVEKANDGRKRKGEIVEVFNTHLHAPYKSEPNDTYLCHRTAQAWEIAKLMRQASERGHLVLGLGDFNMLPLSLAHRVITSQGGVIDAWRTLHPDSSLGPATYPAEKARGNPVPTAKYNLEVNGAASDNVLNTWRWSKKSQKAQYEIKTPPINIPEDSSDPHAKRLDYIFIGNRRPNDDIDDDDSCPEKPGSERQKQQWQVTAAHIGMTTPHPTIHCSLSDHFSIHATLTLLPSSQPPPQIIPPPIELPDLIRTHICKTKRERRLRLAHFLLQAVIVTPACLVGIWFSPHAWVSFLLILISTFTFAAGIIDGFIGGLFGNLELRALKEVGWEIENCLGMNEAGKKNGFH